MWAMLEEGPTPLTMVMSNDDTEFEEILRRKRVGATGGLMSTHFGLRISAIFVRNKATLSPPPLLRPQPRKLSY